MGTEIPAVINLTLCFEAGCPPVLSLHAFVDFINPFVARAFLDAMADGFHIKARSSGKVVLVESSRGSSSQDRPTSDVTGVSTGSASLGKARLHYGNDDVTALKSLSGDGSVADSDVGDWQRGCRPLNQPVANRRQGTRPSQPEASSRQGIRPGPTPSTPSMTLKLHRLRDAVRPLFPLLALRYEFLCAAPVASPADRQRSHSIPPDFKIGESSSTPV
eukprot:TRINITY_DN3334_c0_g1_i7.p2 TRINITY_DN3334_c0_g1~~TRINITY_DN3334_c0_g1_i7.p2  ORF type:complete len:218 (+),score=35.18 TRINITY_DN3334_c0_g1_i7:769-1422(+)